MMKTEETARKVSQKVIAVTYHTASIQHLVTPQPYGFITFNIFGNCYFQYIGAIDTGTCMLIFQLVRSTKIFLDTLSEFACAGTLQRVCCRAEKKLQNIGVKVFFEN